MGLPFSVATAEKCPCAEEKVSKKGVSPGYKKKRCQKEKVSEKVSRKGVSPELEVSLYDYEPVWEIVIRGGLSA